MAIITWNDKLSVGVPQIDQQHKKLIDIVNTFFDAMKSGQGSKALEKAIPELVNYVDKHFSDEEKFMQEIGFPGLQDHQKLHRELTDKVKKLIAAIQSGQSVNTLKVGQFLRDWLTHHISTIDMQYGKHATQQTVKQ